MNKEDQKYKLISKISEDSKTRTYKAEDLVLKRSVIFVQLKKSSSQKDGRAFLLHARTLGQLKHPGILPLHDMGVHDNRYFYSYRRPPGKTLQNLIQLSASGKGPLRARSKQIIYILGQITDTLAYCHKNGVTLGRLYSDTIHKGEYGEVIIRDLAKAQKHEDLQSEEFEKARSDDLQNLAHLGLRMWTLSPLKEKYSIREWDTQAQMLPMELQEVLDRACLERGGKYPNTFELHEDLDNLWHGRPPKSKQGDLIFTMKGAIHKNKKVFLGLIAIISACTITITISNAPLGKLNRKLTEQDISIKDAQQQNVASLGQAKELQEKLQANQEEFKTIHERFSSQKNKQGHAQKSNDLVHGELEQATQNFESETKKAEQLDRAYKKMLEKLSAIKQKLTSPTPLGAEDFKHRDQHPPITAQALNYLHEYQNSRGHALLTSWLNDEFNQDSWLKDYLSKPSQNPHLKASFSIPSQSQATILTQDQLLLWAGEKRIFELRYNDNVNLSQIPVDFTATQIAKLGSKELLLWDGQQAIYTEDFLQQPKWSSPHPWKLNQGQLLNLSPSQNIYFWQSPKLHHIELPSAQAPQAKVYTFPEETTSAQFDLEQKLWFSTSTQIFNPNKTVVFESKLPIIHWAFHPHDTIHIQTPEKIIIRHISKEDTLSPRPWIIPLNAPQEIPIVIDASQNLAWATAKDQNLQLWKRYSPNPSNIDGIQGRPLLFHLNWLITKIDDQVLSYRYPLKNNLKDEHNQLLAMPQEKHENDLFHWTSGPSDWHIILKNSHEIELYHPTSQIRTPFLFSQQPLKKVMYSESINALVALRQDGELITL